MFKNKLVVKDKKFILCAAVTKSDAIEGYNPTKGCIVSLAVGMEVMDSAVYRLTSTRVLFVRCRWISLVIFLPHVVNFLT